MNREKTSDAIGVSPDNPTAAAFSTTSTPANFNHSRAATGRAGMRAPFNSRVAGRSRRDR